MFRRSCTVIAIALLAAMATPPPLEAALLSAGPPTAIAAGPVSIDRTPTLAPALTVQLREVEHVTRVSIGVQLTADTSALASAQAATLAILMAPGSRGLLTITDSGPPCRSANDDPPPIGPAPTTTRSGHTWLAHWRL